MAFPTPLTPVTIQTALQAATLLALGHNPPYNATDYSFVRVGWQQQGQPFPSITEDAVMLTAIEEDDRYNRIRDLATIGNTIPAPAVIPTVVTLPGYAGGTLPANSSDQYWTKFAWVIQGQVATAPSPAAVNFLTAIGALSITPPSPPPDATGYAVYISKANSDGTETLQAIVSGFGTFIQSVPLINGNLPLAAGSVFELVTYTRVWRCAWTLYGPNSFDNARALRSAQLTQQIHDTLAVNSLYLVTDISAPRRVPEYYSGEYWERVDFDCLFNEAVSEITVVGSVASAEVIVENAKGQVADIVIT